MDWEGGPLAAGNAPVRLATVHGLHRVDAWLFLARRPRRPVSLAPKRLWLCLKSGSGCLPAALEGIVVSLLPESLGTSFRTTHVSFCSPSPHSHCVLPAFQAQDAVPWHHRNAEFAASLPAHPPVRIRSHCQAGLLAARATLPCPLTGRTDDSWWSSECLTPVIWPIDAVPQQRALTVHGGTILDAGPPPNLPKPPVDDLMRER